MTTTLTNEIVRHILGGFGFPKTGLPKLHSPEYLLPKKISFEGDQEKENNVWGCKIRHVSQDVKVILGDCSQSDCREVCLIVGLKGSPFYAIYWSGYEEYGNEFPMIATSLDGKAWIECSVYLQGTFLAAMEQIRENAPFSEKLIDFEEMFSVMISFLQFREAMDDLDEGEIDEG